MAVQPTGAVTSHSHRQRRTAQSARTDAALARKHATQAATDFRGSNDQAHLSGALVVLAAAEAALGNMDAARMALKEALWIRRAIVLELEGATERLLIDRYLSNLQSPERL